MERHGRLRFRELADRQRNIYAGGCEIGSKSERNISKMFQPAHLQCAAPNLFFLSTRLAAWRWLKWGTPKSSMLKGFSIINPSFCGISIYGNPHICAMIKSWIGYSIPILSLFWGWQSIIINPLWGIYIYIYYNVRISPFCDGWPQTIYHILTQTHMYILVIIIPWNKKHRLRGPDSIGFSRASLPYPQKNQALKRTHGLVSPADSKV